MRVVKHEADEEKNSFKVALKGEAGDLVAGCLIDVEIRLKGKNEAVLEKFPRGARFQVSLEESETQ